MKFNPPHFSKTKLTVSLALLSQTVFCGNAVADTITLPDTVITATRLATPQKDIISDLLVITEDDLKMHQGQSLMEVLASQPSIQVRTNGGLGQSGGIFIRGNNSTHSLILVDGVQVGSATTGTASIQSISSNQIERIEILYGSSATSLYGSSAIGGVIQVFTKAHNGESQSSFNVATGTENTLDVNASTNGRIGNTSYGLNIAHVKTDGISATKEYVPYNSYESDKDSHKNRSYNFAIQHKLNDNVNFGINLLSNQAKTDYDSGKEDSSTHVDTDINSGSIWLRQSYNDLSLNALWGISNDDSDFDDNWGTSHFATKQKQIKVDMGYQLPIGGKVQSGVERILQEVKSTTDYDVKSRQTDSILFGYLLANDTLQAQVNVRYDNNTNVESVTTYSLNMAYLPMSGLKVGSNFSTGFNQPSFNQLYYPSEWSNPNLLPEKSKNIEVFTELSNDDFNSRVTVYRNTVTDLISGPVNLAEAEMTGVSVKTDYSLDNVTLGLHYDYLDAQDVTKAQALANRAKHSIGASAGYRLDNLSVRGELNYVGDRRADYADDDFAPVSSTLKGYTLANLFTSYKVNEYVDINLRVNNLLDSDYETSYGYNNPSLNILVGINLHTK